jgi:hypothetical protein
MPEQAGGDPANAVDIQMGSKCSEVAKKLSLFLKPAN